MTGAKFSLLEGEGEDAGQQGTTQIALMQMVTRRHTYEHTHSLLYFLALSAERAEQ